MTVRGYQLAGDWSRAGVFTGTLEDVSSYVLADTDVVVSWGRNDARATEDATAGKLSFSLQNLDRYFSPENTGSPIAGKVLPGTRARYQVTPSGATTTLFDGPIDSFTIDPSAPDKAFSAEASDGWSSPGAQQLSTSVYQGMRTGDLIGVILDAIGWTGGRDIDPGATVVPYWWIEGVDASTAVNDLVHSEGPPAIAYVQAGTFVFRDRHHRLTRTASNTSQGTYTHTIPAGAVGGDFKILRDSFTYDHGLNNIINSATLEVTPRAPTDVTQVWNSDSPISLGAGEARVIIAQGSDPFIDAVVPVSGTDYILASGTLASVTLSRTSGQSLYLTVTAGGGGAVLGSGIALRAVPLAEAGTYKVTQEDASSVNLFGRNAWGGSAPWAGIYDAQVITERIVSVYSQARPVISLKIANLDTAHTTQIMARTVSDRITVREDEMGINRDFIVERVTHTVKQHGIVHSLELGCQAPEPQQAANAFQFDVAGHGFNDGAFGVNSTDNPATMFRFDTAGQGFNDGRFSS